MAIAHLASTFRLSIKYLLPSKLLAFSILTTSSSKSSSSIFNEYTGLINKSKENIVKNKMQYITLVNFIKSPSSKIHL